MYIRMYICTCTYVHVHRVSCSDYFDAIVTVTLHNKFPASICD